MRLRLGSQRLTLHNQVEACPIGLHPAPKTLDDVIVAMERLTAAVLTLAMVTVKSTGKSRLTINSDIKNAINATWKDLVLFLDTE